MISAYNIVHAMGNTQLGGVSGDWLRDLYQLELEEVDAAEFIAAILNLIYNIC
jgi:hypothetical protein